MFRALAAVSLAVIVVSHPTAAPARLVCVSSVLMFSPSGEFGFEMPDSATNFWGVAISRDGSGVGTQSVTDLFRTGGVEPRMGWKRGHAEVKPRNGVTSWRYLLRYTLEKAEDCVLSSEAQSGPAANEHGVTVPESASVERVQISTISADSGNENVCATWRGTDVIPATASCGAGQSFAVQKYREPLNPPITVGTPGAIEPVFLEPAQGFRFSCQGSSESRIDCRIEVRWKPKT